MMSHLGIVCVYKTHRDMQQPQTLRFKDWIKMQATCFKTQLKTSETTSQLTTARPAPTHTLWVAVYLNSLKIRITQSSTNLPLCNPIIWQAASTQNLMQSILMLWLITLLISVTPPAHIRNPLSSLIAPQVDHKITICITSNRNKFNTL